METVTGGWCRFDWANSMIRPHRSVGPKNAISVLTRLNTRDLSSARYTFIFHQYFRSIGKNRYDLEELRVAFFRNFTPEEIRIPG